MSVLTFKKLLAGDYDDGRYVTLKTDEELLLEMRSLGWWAWSRPLYKDDHRTPLAMHREGSQEWCKDIRISLRKLGRFDD